MSTLCQLVDGVCAQCGQRSTSRRTCRSVVQVARAEKPVATPCRWLGEPTGVFHKKCCNGPLVIEQHICLCPERMVFSKRSGKMLPGKCTPLEPCHDRRAGIEFCGACKLRAGLP